MNKREEKEVGKRFLEVYCGILFNSHTFEKGQDVVCSYDFVNPRFEEIKARYPIVKIAGKGSDFERAFRLCSWIASNLAHNGSFSLTKNLEYNSISLLDYSYGHSEHGVNCVCKAKILVECCLALGIYARRIALYPNSPYDLDNHVVAEIYDHKRKKWVMLDPTSGGYFTDGKEPLSCIEMRSSFAFNKTASIVLSRQSISNLANLAEKNINWNYYYAKNCFYMAVETVSCFGERGDSEAYLLPLGFDCVANRICNADYMLNVAKLENWEFAALKSLEERACRVRDFKPLIGSTALWNAPHD